MTHTFDVYTVRGWVRLEVTNEQLAQLDRQLTELIVSLGTNSLVRLGLTNEQQDRLESELKDVFDVLYRTIALDQSGTS